MRGRFPSCFKNTGSAWICWRIGKTTKEKALEKVIDRQRKIIADQAMDISILKEVKKHLQKKGLLKPQRRSSRLGISL